MEADGSEGAGDVRLCVGWAPTSDLSSKSCSLCREAVCQTHPLPRARAHALALGTNIHVQILIIHSQNPRALQCQVGRCPGELEQISQAQPLGSLLNPDPWAHTIYTELELLVVGPKNLHFYKTLFIIFIAGLWVGIQDPQFQNFWGHRPSLVSDESLRASPEKKTTPRILLQFHQAHK